jgi:hypothetical protein
VFLHDDRRIDRQNGTDMRRPTMTIRLRSCRRLAGSLRRGGLAALIASAFLLLSSGMAHAHGTNVPAHGWSFFNPVQCSNGGYLGAPEIAVNFPDVMKSWYGGTERVWFTADVYRFNGYQWVAYDNTKPWMYSWANGSGLFTDHRGYSPWHYSNGAHADSSRFAYWNPPHGQYRIMLQFYWDSTSVNHAETRDCTI